jgi:CheY-like chemotaxis protein
MSVPVPGITGTSAGRVKQIVLAEDNPADVALVRMALLDAGVPCELRVLADGQKAVAFIQDMDLSPLALPVDLVLLDIHLPKRDGEEILRFLRSTRRYSKTPVIILTGSDLLRDFQTQKHSATLYFHKPSTLAGYMELGIIAREILAPIDPLPPQLVPPKAANRNDGEYAAGETLKQ